MVGGTGNDVGVANNDRVQAAADQLYAADPAEFTDRRSDLVAQARADGDRAAARAIGSLRRPTRAAWVVNQLARADPDAVARLVRLGDELRAAESALDGGRLRELSQTRRKLLGDLTRQALDGAGVTDPPDALQQEVTGTLSAALADPQVAARVEQAQLAKSVPPTGFGFGLAAGTDDDDAGDNEEPSAAPAPRDRAERQQREARKQAEREQAERERRRRAIDEAEQALAEADRVADSAQRAEVDRESTVRRLEEQLEDAQDALADTKRRSREARTAQRQARKALERLRDQAGS
ncbi:MAG TPA: hypothetical protein VGI00_13170 [Streptosporangiaceae bacterium]|jgi:hypothetical protein